MIRVRSIAAVMVALALATGVAYASWYDDYDDGIAAVKKGRWSEAVQRMSAAIKGNPNESNKARTYGVITINYHPYYYRGVANMNLGRYEEAVADFERTSGPGPENLGSLDVLMERAKKQIAAASAEPEPAPTRPSPAVTQPAAPSPAAPLIDPALRQKAQSALGSAKQRIQAAQQRRATGSQQYNDALAMFTSASTRIGGAKSNEDLNTIISMAENAGDLADLAAAPNAPAPVIAAAPAPAKPAVAADAVLADYKPRLRRALENYFNGYFAEASRDFEALSRQLPGNGWIFAFLGASQYSQFAFEQDQVYRDAAMRSFRKAKRLRSWKGGLPERYFSRRIRKAFKETPG